MRKFPPLLVLCLSVISLWFFCQPLHAQSPLAPTRYYWNKKDGLPDWNINAYLQDEKGLMWLASNAGLFTFDGHTFHLVGSANRQPNASRIVRLAQDVHANIWMVKTRSNLVYVEVFNPLTDRTTPLHEYLGEKKPIEIPLNSGNLIFYNLGSNIWIGNNEEGYLYDGRWRKLYWRSPELEAGLTWVPAKNGFWVIHPQKKAVTLLDEKCMVTDSLFFRDNEIYVAAPDQNLTLSVYYKSTDDLKQIKAYQLSNKSGKIHAAPGSFDEENYWNNDLVPMNEIQKSLRYGWLLKNRAGKFWLHNLKNQRVYDLSAQFPDVQTVNIFYFDRSNAIWCSNPNGLYKLEFKQPLPFRTFLSEDLPTHSIRGMAVADGLLYANAYSGAKTITLADGSVRSFQHSYNTIGLAMLQDGNGFWIGAHYKPIQYVSINRGQSFEISGKATSDVFAFFKSRRFGLLVGTENGVLRIDPLSKQSSNFALKGTEAVTFHENTQGLWVGTNKGLFLLGQDGQVKEKFFLPSPQLGYERLQHIYENSKGALWIATKGAGLIYWEPRLNQSKIYNKNSGLSNNNIHAIYADKKGYLWMPSDFGLMRMDASTGSVQTFFKSDGIADNEFNSLSHYQDGRGRLFFGGINGITWFDPEEVPAPQYAEQQLYIMAARAFNLRKGIYEDQVKYGRKIAQFSLEPTDAYLDIRVSPLLYNDAERLQYAWKIEGLQKEWIVQKSPVIRLGNLPYGKNKLQVKYGFGGTEWSEKNLEVPIQVNAPFYLRWPFVAGFFLLTLAIAWGAGIWRNRRLIAANLQLEKEVRKRTREIEADKQTIAEQARSLQALDEMKSRFFANVTHELRTPLTLILGPLDRIISGEVEGQKKAEFLHTIKKNAHKLLQMVEELLDLSKMENNNLILEESPANFHNFLSDLIEPFQTYAAWRGAKLVLHYECPNDLNLLLDHKKWEKIINNLLSNAIKFTPEGGLIEIRASSEGEKLKITVSDTGAGISPEDLPFIFDRYFQSKSPSKAVQGGTGIGLALCREYAQLLGGSLEARSAEGSGSAFTLTVTPKIVKSGLPPAEQGYSAPDNTAINQPSNQTAGAQDMPYTVLLVEDDRDLAYFIRDILENQNFHVLAASNGHSALNLLNNEHCDLILSDVMMPEMDGFQLLERVKASHPAMPFILLTALNEPQDRLHALRLGVDDYLCKPFVQEELLVRMHKLLERYSARQAFSSENPAAEDIPKLPSYDQVWLSQLEEVVNQHLGDPNFSILQLATKMNASERTIHYKIKTYTGLTPNQYITEARLHKARQLLEARVYSTVAEVCYAVGFKTTQYFARIMKERYGKSPSDFK
jgi:signal transduction histidine kinase/DNA-binding response OmpR family regulator/ligand-binding sensor domain-containing protein